MRYENLKKKNRGVFVWFLKDDIVNYVINYENVNFIYQENVNIVMDTPILRILANKTNKVLDVVEYDDLFHSQSVDEVIVDDSLEIPEGV